MCLEGHKYETKGGQKKCWSREMGTLLLGVETLISGQYQSILLHCASDSDCDGQSSRKLFWPTSKWRSRGGGRLAMGSGVQRKGPEFGSCQHGVREIADRERPMSKAVGQMRICSWWRRGETNSPRKAFKPRVLHVSSGVGSSLSVWCCYEHHCLHHGQRSCFSGCGAWTASSTDLNLEWTPRR